LHVYQSRADKRTHAVLVMGELGPAPALVRVQSQNVLQDVFRARGGHGFAAVEGGLRRIAEEGRGAFVYIDGEPMMEEPATARSEGERALAAADRQLRQYGIGAQILADLGLRKIRLLTSSRKRLVALQSYGLEIVEHVDFAG
ncbi:MAG: bifunctional 3,4-dihydroxy-2-butanone-4-phosphate synthase/GTP cyclohydrolase II, partial [Opitutales bacterium]